MWRFALLGTILFLAVSAWPFPIASSDEDASPHITVSSRNAGFEETVGTTPAHWYGLAGVIPTVSGVRVRQGRYSLRLADSSVTSSVRVVSETLPCVGQARYRAATWLYVESASYTNGAFRFSIVFSFPSDQVSGGALGIWDYLSIEKVAPSNCEWVWVELESLAGNVGAAYFDNVELMLAPSGLETDSSIWAVTVHTDPAITLGETSDLGVGHQRFDFPWSSFEPAQPGSYDWGVIGGWRAHLRNVNQVGIDVLAIVGGSLGTATPTWVNEGNFANEWFAFCTFVGREFGASVFWYQMANEQNWFPHQRFDDATVFNQCFAGISASDSVSDLGHRTSFFRSIVNAATYGPSCWTCDLTDWLGSASASIDVVAIDHYPGEWPGGPYDEDWSHLDLLAGIAIAWGKLSSVMETGRSTASPCDQNCQANWVLNNIHDHVRPTVYAHNADHWNNRYVLLGWYKLRDTGDNVFGLLIEGGTPKAAYATFRSEASTYTGPPFHS